MQDKETPEKYMQHIRVYELSLIYILIVSRDQGIRNSHLLIASVILHEACRLLWSSSLVKATHSL